MRDYLHTGIGSLPGAKKYLRDRWRQVPVAPPVVRPGARFYVTARLGGRTAYLLGPYVSPMTARDNVLRAQRQLSGVWSWASFGTASRPDTVRTVLGR